MVSRLLHDQLFLSDHLILNKQLLLSDHTRDLDDTVSQHVYVSSMRNSRRHVVQLLHVAIG